MNISAQSGARQSGLPALFLSALLASGLAAQSQNGPAGSMTVNALDGAAPNSLQVVVPVTLNLQFSGNPNVPFILAWGPQISVGEILIAPGESLDVGPFAMVEILADGTFPQSFFDYFANTGSGGATALQMNLPDTLGAGSLGALQALMVDPTLPAPFVTFTSATAVSVTAPCDYGAVSYLAGPTFSNHASFLADGATGTVTPNPVPSADYDIENIALARFEQLVSNLTAPGPIDRKRPVTADRPVRDSSNSSFAFIRTIYGDLYSFQDYTTSPNEFGFFFSPGGGLPNVEVPNSRVTNGTSTASPWEVEVSIAPDSSMMAAVYDPASGPDQVYLIRLDGGVFTNNGLGIIDVTPAGADANILEESMRFANGKLWFVDGASLGSGGVLYSVDMDPILPAAAATIPNLGTGMTPTIVDGELYRDPVLGDLYFQAGVGATEEDVYRIENAGAGGIFNITNFASPTEVEEFGDSWDSSDGLISVSNTGLTAAFVTRESASDELYVTSSFVAFAPIHVTGAANFAADQDEIVDLLMIDDDNVMFFCGTTTSAMDLYHFRISTGVVTNVTQTSGMSVPPFGGTPSMDPDGYFTWNNHMVFARDGVLALGPSAGASALNFVGVDFTNLLPINITGDEFFGPTTANTDIASPNATDIMLAPNADVIWFFSPLSATSDFEMFTWNPNVLGAATQVTSNGTNSDLRFDNLAIDDLGTMALASIRNGSAGDEEVAMFTSGGGMVPLTDDLSPFSAITDGSVMFLDPAAPCSGFLYTQGMINSTTPGDAILIAYDFGSNSTTVIDPNPAGMWVYSVGP